MDKKSLRADYMDRRGRIIPDDAKAAGLEVARHLVSIIPASAAVIAGYRAVRGELDVAEAMAQFSERGHALCLPVIQESEIRNQKSEKKVLLFRRWRLGDSLQMGKYGIEIPPESEPELVPDIVLVPLVAFDARGHRLGYGAGFFDRTIQHLRRAKPGVKIIGIAFAAQQADYIPDGPDDERLDMVVTEKEIINL